MLTQHADSHVDHVPAEVLAYVLERFKDDKEFFISTFELPDHLPTLECGLYGPIMGDAVMREGEVTYGNRGDRQYQSRLVDKPKRNTRTCTVIAGKYTDAAGVFFPMVLYTVYGGPPSPPEPGGFPENYPDSKRAEAVTFWARHALAK